MTSGAGQWTRLTGARSILCNAAVQASVTAYTVQPGARVLWCLRRRATDVRCIVYPNTMPIEVRVVQDRDVVLTELFQEEWLATSWAKAYAVRLKAHGWHDSPA